MCYKCRHWDAREPGCWCGICVPILLGPWVTGFLFLGIIALFCVKG